MYTTELIDTAREDFLNSFPDGALIETKRRYDLLCRYCTQELGLNFDQTRDIATQVAGLYDGNPESLPDFFDEAKFLGWYRQIYMEPFDKSLP